MNLFDLYAKLSLDSSEYEAGIEQASSRGSSFAGTLKSGLAGAGKIAAAGISLIAGAATAAGGALLALEESTEEYRIAQGKLNTAFEAAGMGAEAAQTAYSGFYGILGDTDTATEASQLLAKLAQSEEDLSKWTDIAAGVYGTFGDALPIEGMIESANETAKVGQVTGSLADALNWAGISEDAFNEALAECGSEAERNQLIMDTLAGTYEGATEAFYRNNESMVSSRNAQIQMDSALAKLGETVSNVKSSIVGEFLPGLAAVTTAFSDLLSGVEGADEEFSDAVSGLVEKAVAKLPEFLDLGVQMLISITNGIIRSLPTIVAAIPKVITSLVTAIVKLGPSLMESGKTLLSMLANGITNGIPSLLAKLPDVINGFVDFLTEQMPVILEQGTTFLQNFIDGIMDALPEFLEKLPDVIQTFLDFITDNLPSIIDSGMTLLESLIDGIVDAIPSLVESLPKIIKSITDFIAENLPTILNAGIDILLEIIKGILQAIPELAKAVPDIINAITEGIGNLAISLVESGKDILKKIMDGIFSLFFKLGDIAQDIVDSLSDGIDPEEVKEIGKNIITGIWNGIQDNMPWLSANLKGTANSIVNSVKNQLGIHSPSRVFAEIGGYMAEGLGEGWDDEYGAIKKGIENGLNFGPARISAQVTTSGYGAYGTAGTYSPGLAGGNVEALLTQILHKLDMGVYLDGKTLVGKLAGQMDTELGLIQANKMRGVRV